MSRCFPGLSIVFASLLVSVILAQTPCAVDRRDLASDCDIVVTKVASGYPAPWSHYLDPIRNSTGELVDAAGSFGADIFNNRLAEVDGKCVAQYNSRNEFEQMPVRLVSSIVSKFYPLVSHHLLFALS